MKISRRSVLLSVPLAGLTIASPLPSAAAPGGSGSSALLENATALFAGTVESNAVPAVAAKVVTLTRNARARLALLDTATGDEIFRGLPLGTSESNLTTAFTYVAEIAVATRAPGGELHGDAAVQQRALATLDRILTGYFEDPDIYFGNWFHWEIGCPTQLTRALVLLADQADPALVRRSITAMDVHLRNGKDGDVDLDSRFHTGANLADITGNRILQGALLGDDARIAKAIGDQRTVFATIDPYHLQHGVSDGYYADGSFIQHHSVAYTGSYGRALLTRVAQTLDVLHGTDWLADDTLPDTVLRWLRSGFAPLVTDGWMMEAVKGRAVSRTNSGYSDVATIAEAAAALVRHVDEGWVASYAKHLIGASRTDPARFASPVTVAAAADLLADDSIPSIDAHPSTAHTHFAAMERSVHRRPGWTFVVSRNSDRISKYEYMNAENLQPWFQGEGAHHLYLAGQDQSQIHGVDGLVLAPAHRLPGVIAPDEVRRTVPELYGNAWYEDPDHGFTSSSEAQNTYIYFPTGTDPLSGGAVLDDVGSAALRLSDDAAHRDRGQLPDTLRTWPNARATRSWFFHDDQVVLLAAGIHDPAGRRVLTTLDRRPVLDGEITGRRRDGRSWTGNGTAALDWLRLSDGDHAIGYRFLDAPPIDVVLTSVSASRRSVRTANPDTTVTRDVLSLTASGASSLAWSIHPGATATDLQRQRRIRVLSNTADLQAIADLSTGLVGIHSFGSGWHRTEQLSVQGPACLLLRHQRRGASLAVSDPTTLRASVPLNIPGHVRVIDTVSGSALPTRLVSRSTVVSIPVAELYGRSRVLDLQPV